MGTTSRKLRDRSKIVPGLIMLYDDIELAWQLIVLALYSRLSVFRRLNHGRVRLDDAPESSRVRPERAILI